MDCHKQYITPFNQQHNTSLKKPALSPKSQFPHTQMKTESSCNNTNNEIQTDHKNHHQQEEQELRRGPWTLEEDTLLIHYVACHGEGRWNLLAKSAGKFLKFIIFVVDIRTHNLFFVGFDIMSGSVV